MQVTSFQGFLELKSQTWVRNILSALLLNFAQVALNTNKFGTDLGIWALHRGEKKIKKIKEISILVCQLAFFEKKSVFLDSFLS